MLKLPLGGASPDRLRILAIGAHADDIELGAAGTVHRLIRERASISLRYVVLSAFGDRGDEARRSALALAAGAANLEISLHELADGRFPARFGQLKAIFESLKSFDPDLVLTHRLEDRHQDHRLVAEVTWQTFRDHLVLEYEIPKYEGDLGAANVYVPLDPADVAAKLTLLTEQFRSQHERSWYDEAVFRAVLRLRGIESNAPSGYAEAFTGRKLTV